MLSHPRLSPGLWRNGGKPNMKYPASTGPCRFYAGCFGLRLNGGNREGRAAHLAAPGRETARACVDAQRRGRIPEGRASRLVMAFWKPTSGRLRASGQPQRGEQPIKPEDPYLLRDVATILLDCGLRPEECYRLRWEHVRDDALHIPFGKTANARRSIPLPNRAAVLLDMRQIRCRPRNGFFRRRPRAATSNNPP